ncbi:hypothetical protein JKF63_00899 [Porcisia hertigi]|uniref:Uncharacterized protein n=1 Tax=Porcisia hertigi TaxID=2761500 RepID=A0A836KYR7_9TRYP|nr:hypothetical protein JKF63_00899 [Porcisia hertigi]
MSALFASRAAQAEFAGPAGIVESLQILRSQNPYYMSVLYPSSEQVEDLNAVIRCLRLQLEGGVSEATGDETAYELAVALLWHSDAALVQEGVELMLYLLKGRWEEYWTTVVCKTHGAVAGDDDDDDGEEARRQAVQSASNVDHDSDNNVARRHNSVSISAGSDEGQCSSTSGGAADVDHCSLRRPGDTVANSTTIRGPRVIRRGFAVQLATAPPPPEDECRSAPLSLVRDRGPSVGPSGCVGGASVAPSSSSNTTTSEIIGTLSPQRSSDARNTAPGTADSSAHKCSWACEDAQSHQERLAKCNYHLAVGYTKLRNNDEALFYVDNMLRFTPCSEEGLLLRRLLCARLNVKHIFLLHVPLLPKFFLFL